MTGGADYDVVVIGGGPAGSVCALCLARLGWRVLLADRARSEPARLALPEMLAPEGVRLLERLGLSSALQGPAASPCRGVLSFWNSDVPDFTDFALLQLRRGQTVNRRLFDANLRSLAGSAGVNIRGTARVRFTSARGASERRTVLELMEDDAVASISASFVVEAAGRVAALGVTGDNCARRLYFDRLVAIPIPAPTLERDGVLRIAPARLGWWYAFAAEDCEGIAVYLTDRDLLPPGSDALATHVIADLCDLPDIGTPWADNDLTLSVRAIRDARTTCRGTLWQGRWLPMGDALFTLDPLSGSGLTRALRMADRAASGIDSFLAAEDTTALSEFAISSCEEFAMARDTGRRLYLRSAVQFPDSEFWRRRSSAGAAPV